MPLAVMAEIAPLELNEDGVALVGKTRVTLDTVVAFFKQSVTAEEIVYLYPSLNLTDVYGTIAFSATSRKSKPTCNIDSSNHKKFVP